jgi:hypothetical protein
MPWQIVGKGLRLTSAAAAPESPRPHASSGRRSAFDVGSGSAPPLSELMAVIGASYPFRTGLVKVGFPPRADSQRGYRTPDFIH